MAACVKCGVILYKAERDNIAIHPNGFAHKDCSKALGRSKVVSMDKSTMKRTDAPFPSEPELVSRKTKDESVKWKRFSSNKLSDDPKTPDETE